MDVRVGWVSNLSKNKNQSPALLGAHDILLSDFQIKFQPKEGVKGGKPDARVDQAVQTKLKVTVGNKAFELNGTLDPIKITRFARIVYFIVKSQEEDFSFSL